MERKASCAFGIPLFLLALLPAALGQVGQFWHVSDFHYDHTYWTQMLSNTTARELLKSRGIFGDQWLDSPWLLVNDTIASMAAIKPDPDFLIWTGDTVAHIKDQYLSEDINMNIVYNVTDALRSYFPNQIVYASFGNHDYFPSNQYPGNGTSSIYNTTADLWKDWIQEENQLDNFRYGGYYTRKTKDGLRIVALNTNLYYTSDKQTADWEDPAHQFLWLSNVLTAARNRDEKVMLTAHIPPGILGWEDVMWFQERFNTRLLAILRQFKDVITVFHHGHEHSDGFKLIYDQDTPAIPLFSAPSVTPWRYQIPNKTGEGHNPGMRLVTFNRTTGAVLEVSQYYLNLREANSRNSSQWKLLYNLTSAYGVPDCSAGSLHKIREKMEKDASVTDRYLTYTTVSWEDRKCSRECQGRIICAFRHQERSSFDTCFAPYTQGASGLACYVVTLSLTLVFGLLLWL